MKKTIVNKCVSCKQEGKYLYSSKPLCKKHYSMLFSQWEDKVNLTK